MKKALFILCLCFPFSGYVTLLMGQDSLVYAKKEIRSVDPLSYNTQTYTKLKNQKIYNYYRLKVQNKSIFDTLHEKFNEWLFRALKKTIDRKAFDSFVLIAGIIFIVVMGIIFFIRKPGIFYINKTNPLVYSVEEENIEIQDLDFLTENSIQEKRFPDAIRWQYLKTLKILHERDYISYEANKTVNEYVHEIKDMNRRKHFQKLSVEFVYYRYGKGEADMDKFTGFRTDAEIIQKM